MSPLGIILLVLVLAFVFGGLGHHTYGATYPYAGGGIGIGTLVLVLVLCWIFGLFR